MDLGLKGKYALVTGGSHGIGKSIALALAKEGCDVAICARNEKRIDDTIAEIERHGVRALGISADVLEAGEIDRVIKTVIDTWGTIHILVNNIGGGGEAGSKNVEETNEQVWRDVFEANAFTAMKFTIRVIPFMRTQHWGRVITIASKLGKEGGGRPWYTIAKSAEIALMKTLALTWELSRDGITFNSIAPGKIMTSGSDWEKRMKENLAAHAAYVDANCPLKRFGTPEEIAHVALFLCSEKSSYVNGACIAVDGGESKSF